MQKVFVGLSGGVDSATSAALLKEQGYQVTGVFIKIWAPEFLECTWRTDRLDAMRAAAAIGIPFREIDLSEAYKREVVDRMVADYARGITPNPDVLCNERIKFGAFLQWALAEGADMVATGHYARTSTVEVKPRQDISLMRSVDTAKDQSYFLHRIGGNDLKRVLFPIGGLTKSEVREEAKRFGLPMATKPDSQGLCFVGDVSMADFLRRFIPVEKGKVLDMHGEIVGGHEGAPLYTIGQRHGFTVYGANAAQPHYVIAIDTQANAIIVSADKSDAAREEISLRDMHWIDKAPTLPARLVVQTRYHETPVTCMLRQNDDGTHIAHFDTPHIVSPGQSIVFYDGEVCLGGAIIE